MAVRIKNPQTWVRLRRNDMRKLANQIGNHVMRQIVTLDRGDTTGRAVKELTEKITRKLDAQPLSSDIEVAYADLEYAARLFREIKVNEFFAVRVAERVLQQSGGQVMTAAELLDFYVADVAAYIEEYRASLPPPPSPAELIVESVPQQKLGPARFEMIDGIVRVQHQAAVNDGLDARNAEAARSELLSSSQNMVGFLAGSNFDSRLTATIEDIRTRLEVKQDIIQLGIAAISAQMVCEEFEEELPGIWGAKLRAFSIGIGMYVSQFPEWGRFSENAALAEFNPGDVKKLYSSGMELVTGLRTAVSVVDPEVPQTLAFLFEVIKDPRRAIKRTVFAAMRSIENFVIVVVRSLGGTLKAAVDGLHEGIKLGAKYVTATTILLLAANVATTISPAAGRILQSNWMGKVGEFIKDGLKHVD